MSNSYDFANLPGSFSFGGDVFSKTIQGVPTADWLRRPGEGTNHLLWIVGHVINTRGLALQLLGAGWTDPWPGLFGRGAVLVADEEYPPVPDMLAAWADVAKRLPEALGKATPEVLSATPPPGLPTFDGKISGVMTFFAYHEAYHGGQAGYLRKWLGHGQAVG